MRDLEHIAATHTPASVPVHKRGYPYSVKRSHIVVECENEHRMLRDGDGFLGMDHLLVWGSY